MRRLKALPFLRHNRAISYTISALIMTVTTVALVIAASFYALQVLEQQRGQAEFEVAVKSILAFDDVLENVAWKGGNGTLSTRFTVQYGELRIIPETSSSANVIKVEAIVGSNSYTLYSDRSMLLSYFLSNRYVSFGEGHKQYVLGNESALLVGSTGSYGRAVVMQHSGWVNVTLDFRVRAMVSSRIYIDGKYVNYIDVWVIKTEVLPWLRSYDYYAYLYDFDLKARSISAQAASSRYTIPSGGNARLNVMVGKTATNPPATFSIAQGEDVVFNVIVARVQVYV